MHRVIFANFDSTSSLLTRICGLPQPRTDLCMYSLYAKPQVDVTLILTCQLFRDQGSCMKNRIRHLGVFSPRSPFALVAPVLAQPRTLVAEIQVPAMG